MSEIGDIGGAELDFSSEITTEAAPEEGLAGDVNWEERYRAEVQDRIRERERYKPIKQVFDGMHPEDAQAVQQFAQAWAAGDQDAAIRWMVDNARSLAGDNFTQYIQGQQQVVNNAVAQGQAAGLTPEAVQQLVQQQIAQYQEQQQIQQYTVEIDQTIRSLGLEPETPFAHAVILAATNREDLSLEAAYADMENQILQQAQAIVERRRSAGAAMPAASPNGVAGIVSPGASPRDRAMARLAQNPI
jgi:hypothetical protein